MRPVMHGDVVAAARVLYAAPREQRKVKLRHMLRGAGWADHHRRRTGKLHPIWGDGSLMVAALMQKPPPEPRLSDVDYCSCLEMVFRALCTRRTPQPLAQPTQLGTVGSSSSRAGGMSSPQSQQ